MVILGGLYELYNQYIFVSGFYLEKNTINFICNKAIKNEYDKKKKYYSYINNDFKILNSSLNISYNDFKTAIYLNTNCLGCKYYSCYNYLESFPLQFSNNKIFDHISLYYSGCEIRSNLNAPIQGNWGGIPNNVTVKYTNCQFKRIDHNKLLNLIPANRNDDKFIQNIIQTYMYKFNHDDGVEFIHKTHQLDNYALNPYQVDFLRTHTQSHLKIYFTGLLELEDLINGRLEIYKNYKQFFDYCYPSNFTISAYLENFAPCIFPQDASWLIAEGSNKKLYFSSKNETLYEDFQSLP